MMDEFEDAEAPAEDLTPCTICGRSFFPKVLAKHTPVCKKAAAKKRKIFDSSRQRAEGTDISTLKPLKPKSQSASSVKAEPPKKPSNWRQNREDFIAAIRAAKGVKQALKDGGPLPPPPPPSLNPDYIQCPCCQRRFNQNAADRHISFCREKAARLPKAKGAAEVKNTPPPRTQYKPPVKKTPGSAPSSLPAPSSRLPQRSVPGQLSGIPTCKPSAGSLRSALSSPHSGGGMRSRPVSSGSGSVSSGYGSVRNAQAGLGPNRKKEDLYLPRSKVLGNGNGNDEVADGGGVLSSFCHECGTKYPVECAKFCCECGLRRMCM